MKEMLIRNFEELKDRDTAIIKIRKKPIIVRAQKIPIKYRNIDIKIKTMNGFIKVDYVHDWIIEGVNKELYPCNEEIFWKTYEVVNL